MYVFLCRPFGIPGVRGSYLSGDIGKTRSHVDSNATDEDLRIDATTAGIALPRQQLWFRTAWHEANKLEVWRSIQEPRLFIV